MEDTYDLQALELCDQLHQDLYEMMKGQILCDTKILTMDGETLTAHANILAARSELLKKTFGISSSRSFQLNTEHISAESWKAVLHFMYLGKTSIGGASLQQLFDAAEMLEMTQLQELCKQNLIRIQADRIADGSGQTEMLCMETQTEEEILKFASGEKSTLYGYGDEAGVEDSVDPEQELQVGDKDCALYLAEADESEKRYIAVAAPATHDSTQATISITKNSQSTVGTQSNTTGSRVLQKDMLFKCGICNKFYSSKQGLERHAILHTTKKGYTCERCGKSFKVERYLLAHVERHNMERSYQCPICGKGFKTQRDASWHQKTVHTGDKKHQCPHCNYAGKTKSLLNQHMFSHTNSKQFACPTCGKTFLRKQHLLQHRERHEGKRRFMCSACGAEFYTIYACKEHHMRIHQGLKKYECSVCGQQYNEKKSFMKHLQRHSVDLVLKLESDIVVQVEQTVEQPVTGGGHYSDVEGSVANVNSAESQYDAVQYQSHPPPDTNILYLT